ncbi:hypothetical protein XELAEV_18004986mg [Xenopus laevis]|uniref:Uncharacterized protein n=1 Tax=Xenopus laevis TaxID=8355 RepID=A0A974I2H2_XENLA|nr:hypothetical protein XELAEV_18004986mg [Xenopus laevis]
MCRTLTATRAPGSHHQNTFHISRLNFSLPGLFPLVFHCLCPINVHSTSLQNMSWCPVTNRQYHKLNK